MPVITSEKGYIFDIQRYSVHDGPGIRTVVFLKGCPLACPWCSNPESQRLEPEVAYFLSNCVGNFDCVEVCPKSAISPLMKTSKVRSTATGYIAIDRSKCDNCGLCVVACKNNALRMSGVLMSVDEVLKEVMKDQPFYYRSGGGLTLSGGEPAFQKDFAQKLLAKAKNLGIHTAMETCGMQGTQAFEDMCEQVDLVLYDVKILDSSQHRKILGVPNDIILRNLANLVELGHDVIVRIPIVPGYTDSEENVREIAKFLSVLLRRGKNEELTVRGKQFLNRVELVPYHRLGEYKYRALGRRYALKGTVPPGQQQLERLRDIVSDYGLAVQIGG